MSDLVSDSTLDAATWIGRAQRFRDLHVAGKPLVLFNAWDAGSANAVADAGAPAIATSSWAVAAAHGYSDGEQLPLEAALANLRRIVKSVELPVSVDLEAGYGTSPEAVAAAVRKVIAAGAIGLNLEDQDIRRGALYSIGEQSIRIAAARKAANAHAPGCFINARTDLFLNIDPTGHDVGLIHEAIRRAAAYADAGADGFFAPGLRNESLIAGLRQECPLPLNIMVVPDLPAHGRLAELGVSRISYGPQPYRLAMQSLAEAASGAYSIAISSDSRA
jgi:methylisocitrate lyase